MLFENFNNITVVNVLRLLFFSQKSKALYKTAQNPYKAPLIEAPDLDPICLQRSSHV